MRASLVVCKHLLILERQRKRKQFVYILFSQRHFKITFSLPQQLLGFAKLYFFRLSICAFVCPYLTFPWDESSDMDDTSGADITSFHVVVALNICRLYRPERCDQNVVVLTSRQPYSRMLLQVLSLPYLQVQPHRWLLRALNSLSIRICRSGTSYSRGCQSMSSCVDLFSMICKFLKK